MGRSRGVGITSAGLGPQRSAKSGQVLAEWRVRAARILEIAGRTEEARSRYALAVAEIEATETGRRSSRAWMQLEAEARVALARIDGGGRAAELETEP